MAGDRDLKVDGVADRLAGEIKSGVVHLTRSPRLAPYRPDAFRGALCSF